MAKAWGFWAFVAAAGVVVGSFVFAIAAVRRWDRRRLEGVGRALEERGFSVTHGPEPGALGTFERQAEWGGWTRGRVQWVARRDDCLVLEHTYLTSSGSGSQQHIHTVYAVFDPACTRLRGLWLVRPAGRFERGALAKRPARIVTGDERFDEEWIVVRTHGEAAPVTLSEPLRRALAGGPKGEAWFFWDGWASCTYKHPLDAPNVGLFVERAESVVAAL